MSSSTRLLAVITTVIVIAALYFGKDLVVPFALALLLSFLLSTPINTLERLRLGRTVAVVIVLITTSLLAAGLIWLGLQQVSGMAVNLPNYRVQLLKKVERLRSPAGPGVLGVIENITQLGNELTSSPAQALSNQDASAGSSNTRRRPVAPLPVQIVKADTSVLSSLGLVSASLLHYLGLIGAVAILTLFMLLNRSHLRNRLFRLFGQGHLVLMTTALDEAAQRVSRYLLTQSLVNTTFGVALGLGLWLIGVPYAPFWGAFAACLRFVPYVGTFLAGACPFLLSLAIFDGWSKPLLTVALFAGIEAVTSAAVEPWLYSTRTGVSSLAILLSAAFWTLVWGPIGLILSTPMTVCLAVLGRHVPPLAFLHVLLGDEPVLTPDLCYYQRLLAMDDDEATELSEEFLKNNTLAQLYDQVVIPALGYAERDKRDDRLEEHRLRFLYRSTRDLLDELSEGASLNRLPADAATVLCVPVRSEGDELIGNMLAQVLPADGWKTECLSLNAIQNSSTSDRANSADVIILSALPPFAILPARSLCRKLRRSHPTAKIILAIWNSATPAEKIGQRLGPQCANAVVTSIEEARNQLRSMFEAPALPEESPANAELSAV